jgi:putative ABC transport system substrate-binding protein
MERRGFVALLGSALACLPPVRAWAQKRPPVLGILSPFRRPPPEAIAKSPLIGRLRQLGWSEGETLHVERAFAENEFERLPELAAMLVAKQADVIWTWGPAAAVAAARATRTIPVVFWWTPFPIELGLIDSYARPGRNATGTAWSASGAVEEFLKIGQLLREIAPDSRRLARLVAPSWLRTVKGEAFDSSTIIASVDSGLSGLGFEWRRFEVHKDGDFEPAFDAITQWRADSLLVPPGDLTARAGKRIVDFARRNRLADGYSFHSLVEQGGLIAYGFNPGPSFVRTADYVDRILRGARPADLPVELPRDYEIVVNLKTARTLGLKIPQSLLLRADRVIE